MIRVYCCLQKLHARGNKPFLNDGFTLVELLIVVFILGIIMGGLFLTFNVGQSSFPVTSARLEAQSEARNAMNWIMKDLRQAIAWNIANNNATTDYLRMNRWTWNDTTNQWDVTNATDFVEYLYNTTSRTLTRHYVDALGGMSTLQFNNITEAPFYTNLAPRGFTENELRLNRSIFVVISVEKSIRGSITVP